MIFSAILSFYSSKSLILSLSLIADGAHPAALETFKSHLFEPGRQSFRPLASCSIFKLVSFTRIALEPPGLFAAHRFEVSLPLSQVKVRLKVYTLAPCHPHSLSLSHSKKVTVILKQLDCIYIVYALYGC